MNNTLTDVPGFRVGHATNTEAATGCTVILPPEGTIGGVDIRGGAPGTRETDLLRPMHLVEHVSAILLSGGSAFGLAAADGVMQYCEENGIGQPTSAGVVPIVPTAILFDLDRGTVKFRPDRAMGYQACQNATTDPVISGTIGAGTGARVGVIMGVERATKGGIGCASIDLGGGLIVAALVAVNAVGDIVDEQGQVIAGVRDDAGAFVGALNVLRMMHTMSAAPPTPQSSNTVIGVVATNAKLDKVQVNKVASMAQNGLAQAIRPAHTMYDGDTLFTLASGQVGADVNLVGAFAAEMTAQAIRNAVRVVSSALT